MTRLLTTLASFALGDLDRRKSHALESVGLIAVAAGAGSLSVLFLGAAAAAYLAPILGWAEALLAVAGAFLLIVAIALMVYVAEARRARRRRERDALARKALISAVVAQASQSKGTILPLAAAAAGVLMAVSGDGKNKS